MPLMKFGGNITENGQEDELNSEKCGAGGHSGKTLRIAQRLCIVVYSMLSNHLGEGLGVDG